MLGISFHDLQLVFGGVIWDLKTIARTIPLNVWPFIILAVGFRLFELKYPYRANLLDERNDPNKTITPTISKQPIEIETLQIIPNEQTTP